MDEDLSVSATSSQQEVLSSHRTALREIVSPKVWRSGTLFFWLYVQVVVRQVVAQLLRKLAYSSRHALSMGFLYGPRP